MSIRAGKKAPDFTAKAYWKGEFKKITLSNYTGRWVVLFFYPGDFTFV
jgi:alkyl hydroperoxide reductase subunit AhpC